MEYKFKQRKGIDDLKSLYAFKSSSQGDDFFSNSIEDYKNSKGYMSFVFNCELTPEVINKEIVKRALANEEYLKELFTSGEYGKEYEISIHFKENPIFDNNPKVQYLVSNHSFIIIDCGK